jgi:hypothetical protein
VKPPTAYRLPPWKKLTPEEGRKAVVILRESPPSASAKRLEKISPSAMTTAPAFEVHEGPLSAEPQPIIKTPVEASAAPTTAIAEGPELKTDIATLLASKSGLRDAIILREIFGRPRSLQPLDLVGNT